MYVDTFGTAQASEDDIYSLVKSFDLRPAAIIKIFCLKRPILKQTASYGHFGRTDVSLPWEEVGLFDKIVGVE